MAAFGWFHNFLEGRLQTTGENVFWNYYYSPFLCALCMGNKGILFLSCNFTTLVNWVMNVWLEQWKSSDKKAGESSSHAIATASAPRIQLYESQDSTLIFYSLAKFDILISQLNPCMHIFLFLMMLNWTIQLSFPLLAPMWGRNSQSWILYLSTSYWFLCFHVFFPSFLRHWLSQWDISCFWQFSGIYDKLNYLILMIKTIDTIN